MEQVAKARLGLQTPVSPVDDKYRCTRGTRQRQKRLDDEQVSQLVVAYRLGATVYELAAQFGCHRSTVSELLRSRGVSMRHAPLTEAQIDQAIELYESGLSLTKVGKLVEANAETVRQRLLGRGVKLRGPHDCRVPD